MCISAAGKLLTGEEHKKGEEQVRSQSVFQEFVALTTKLNLLTKI